MYLNNGILHQFMMKDDDFFHLTLTTRVKSAADNKGHTVSLEEMCGAGTKIFIFH